MDSQLIQKKFISTSYSKVCYRSAGNIQDPLFLIIHGSGTGNSSSVYENLLFEYVSRFASSWKLFLVAIDCPGYGESTGLRSVIRAFPEKFLSEFIFNLTKKNSCFILYGHSQGGYSIFNALLQNPKLCNFLVQDRPVCGDIKRLSKLNTPILLIYDEEDDGHPISQGYQIMKQMKNNKFFKYKGSKQPYWVSDNMLNEVIKFIYEKKDFIINQKDCPDFNKIEEFNGIKFEVIIQKSNNLLEFRNSRNNSNDKRLVINEINLITKEEKLRSVSTDNNSQNLFKNKKNNNPSNLINDQLNIDFYNSDENIINEKEEEYKEDQISIDDLNKTLSRPDINLIAVSPDTTIIQPNIIQLDNLKCPLCLEILILPIKLICNHIFCRNCLETSLYYNPSCPMCRTEIDSSKVSNILDLKNVDKDIENMIKSNVDINEIEKRMKELANNKDKSKMIRIEYGNTAQPIENNKAFKKSYKWCMYVKIAQSPVKDIIKSVEFNINTHMPEIKPICVKNPPYILEKNGTYEFTALIKVNFNSNVEVGFYSTYHKISFNSPKTSRNFIVYLKK